MGRGPGGRRAHNQRFLLVELEEGAAAQPWFTPRHRQMDWGTGPRAPLWLAAAPAEHVLATIRSQSDVEVVAELD